jgi:hypothetical protein
MKWKVRSGAALAVLGSGVLGARVSILGVADVEYSNSPGAEGGSGDAPTSAADGPDAGSPCPALAVAKANHLTDVGTVGAGDAGPIQLWLTAECGITCALGHVESWADESGHRRDATRSGLARGPLCEAKHMLNGVDLPYFSSPDSGASDGILTVPLDWLAGTDFTLFVVERRTGDRPLVAPSDLAEFFLGTDFPDLNVQGCPPNNPNADNRLFAFGYAYYAVGAAPPPSILFEPFCHPFSAPVGPHDPDPNAAPVINAGQLSSEAG